MNEKSKDEIISLIEKALKEKVDPILEEHHGGATLSKFENEVAVIRLVGACASCPSAQLTIEDVVRDILMEEVPEVKDVELDNSISDDLLDMARKILNKNN